MPGTLSPGVTVTPPGRGATKEADFIGGGPGNDLIDGGRGDDRASGDAGDDRVSGSGGDDWLFGDAVGGNGDDLLVGGKGDDLLMGDFGDDVLLGGPGIDQVSYRLLSPPSGTSGVTVDLASGQATSGADVDQLAGIEDATGTLFSADRLEGNRGANALAGLGGDDVLVGGQGDDILTGGPGDDLLVGGGGFDIATYAARQTFADVDLRIDGAQGTGAGTDTLVGIEGLRGTRLGNHLTGDGHANLLDGFNGDDRLEGRAGNDRLEGGSTMTTCGVAWATTVSRAVQGATS